MKYIVKVQIPIERGNELLSNPEFGRHVEELMKELKVEHAYFSTVDKQRGGYFIMNIDEASQIPVLFEPLFFFFKGDIEFLPVMELPDLQKAGPGIGAAVKKWSVY